jgi:cold shock CspA family protein
MAKARESFNKKENEKNRDKKRKEKEQKKEERKANKTSASSFEDMLAYVDENGNLTTTPPDPTKKRVIREEDIEIGVRKQEPPREEDKYKRGRITFFNDSKGYGFIKDAESQESVFVHINAALDPIKEGDKVVFEVEKSPKGLNAVRVKLDK